MADLNRVGCVCACRHRKTAAHARRPALAAVKAVVPGGARFQVTHGNAAARRCQRAAAHGLLHRGDGDVGGRFVRAVARHHRNAVNHGQARNHPAKHSVARRRRAAVVQKQVVRLVDKELGACRVRHTGAGHGNGAAQVAQAIVTFQRDVGVGRCFVNHACGVATTLVHKARNDPVKQGAGIKPAVGVSQHIGHRDGRLVRVELYHHGAHAGGHRHPWVYQIAKCSAGNELGCNGRVNIHGGKLNSG